MEWVERWRSASVPIRICYVSACQTRCDSIFSTHISFLHRIAFQFSFPLHFSLPSFQIFPAPTVIQFPFLNHIPLAFPIPSSTLTARPSLPPLTALSRPFSAPYHFRLRSLFHPFPSFPSLSRSPLYSHRASRSLQPGIAPCPRQPLKAGSCRLCLGLSTF